jgi:hypothetical protein
MQIFSSFEYIKTQVSRSNTSEGTYSKLLKTSVLFADKPRLVSCFVLVVQIRNVYSRPTYITEGL